MINPLPAPAPADEYDTEPQMPAVSGLLCWYCDNPALKDTYCAGCHVALCADHKHSRIVAGERMTVCPDHRGAA